MHTWFFPYSINNKSIQECYSCYSQTCALCQNTSFTHILSSLLMAGYKSLGRKSSSRQRLCSCWQKQIRGLIQVWRMAHHNFFLTVLLFQLLESPDLFCAMALPVISQEVTIGSCLLSCGAPSSLSRSHCQCFPYKSGLPFQCSSLPPSWQMVHSSAAATAKSDSWRCHSTIKIFQHCCSEILQWQEVTVKNSIMYLEAFIHPSLNTDLEGTAVPISTNLHYLSIMNFCCIKANMLHSGLPSWNSHNVVEVFNSC